MVRVSGVRCVKMELGEPDASGRRRPIPIKDSEFVIPADTMIAAVAQAPEISFLDESHGLEVTPKGTFAVDPLTLATNRPGVFAGGDVARGPWILIQAIADGRRGALSIDRYLRGVDLLTPREQIPLPVVDLSQEEIDQMVEEGKVDLAPRTTVPDAARGREDQRFSGGGVGPYRRTGKAGGSTLSCLRHLFRMPSLCPGLQKRGDRSPTGSCSRRSWKWDLSSSHQAILSTNPELSPELGYGRYPNVVTSMEFERMLSASGPWGGHVTRRSSDHREPKKIAFLQCVGSREKGARLLQFGLLHVCDQRGDAGDGAYPRGGNQNLPDGYEGLRKGFRCLLRKREGEREFSISLAAFLDWKKILRQRIFLSNTRIPDGRSFR